MIEEVWQPIKSSTATKAAAQRSSICTALLAAAVFVHIECLQQYIIATIATIMVLISYVHMITTASNDCIVWSASNHQVLFHLHFYRSGSMWPCAATFC
jgi:hypothetical protein